MSTRDTYLKDYGLTYEDGRRIVAYCRKARDYDQRLILQAAQEVYISFLKSYNWAWI